MAIVERTAGGSSLIDVLDRVLDKGIVIDAWVRISLVGIDLITVEARVVVASIDTYLRYAEAMGGEVGAVSTNGAVVSSLMAFGSGRSQSSRVFAGRCGHASPQPIVTTASQITPAGRSSRPLEHCAPRSIPRSFMKAAARGLTWPEGREPALWAMTRPGPNDRANPSAICDRQEFSTQTKST